jgi:hypothetical protein
VKIEANQETNECEETATFNGEGNASDYAEYSITPIMQSNR